MLRGWALAEQGHGEQRTAQICQSLTAFRATGGKFNLSFYLALLIEAYAKAGKTEQALTTLAEALAAVDDNGERLYEAELYRLRGQLTLQLGQFVDHAESPIRAHILRGTQSEIEAEGCFRRAIEIGGRQSAKSWQLRATTKPGVAVRRPGPPR
jgi:predicted ATPase